MKNIIAFILGALAIIILDMVWASKGYADDNMVECFNITTGQTMYFKYNCPLSGPWMQQ